jgi:nucleoside 2-deoxyribosyltransferase
MKPSVYLAGPIAHLSGSESRTWRKAVSEQLRPIKCYSPMRDTHMLGDDEIVTAVGYSLPIVSNRGILARDRFDVQRCDVIFVNLLGAQRISIGTCIEIGWGHLLQKPVVAVMEPGNIHEHAMVLEAIDYRVNTLDHACDIVRSLLDVQTDPPAIPVETVPRRASSIGKVELL